MSDDDDVRWWMANSGQKGSSGYSPDSKDFHLLSSVSAPGWEVDLCELCIKKQLYAVEGRKKRRFNFIRCNIL